MTRRRRRLATTLSTLVALGTGTSALALAYWPGDNSEPATPTATDVALLSPRRAPEALRTFVADTRLGSRVDAFAANISRTSCLMINANAAAIYSHNPDQALIPASALKLTTAAAFLAKVGGKGKFTTMVQASPPDSSGTVRDNLVFVGDGDPLLATPGYVATRKHPPSPATDLTALAKKIQAAGVRRVTGGIDVADATFDAERRVPTWKIGYTTSGDVGPIGALVVNDGFSSYTPLVAAPDPAIAAGDALRSALAALGVVVEGPTRRASHKDGRPLAEIASVPYSEVVAEMLRESDNNTAEALLKRLAFPHGDGIATRALGAAARSAALEDLGIKKDAVRAIDGSGLDRSDRATCSALLATLTTKPGGYDLEDMLAVAGKTGTLNDRFTTSPLAGRLRAKTGSLEDVTALVGLVDPAAPVKLRFAFISNGDLTDAGGKALQDRLVAALATYPEAPDAASLAP